MTLKRFSILASIVIGIVIAATITLACIKVDSGLGLEPDRIIVYLEETAGTTCDATNNTTHFNKLKKLYKDMTKLSIFDYMIRGNVIDTVPGQDYDKELSTWSYTDKQNNNCLELIFKEKQTVVVSIDGDTKAIDFYGLIMVTKKSTISKQVAFYFSTTEDYDATKSYSDSPILVQANQTKLAKYLEFMKTTQE